MKKLIALITIVFLSGCASNKRKYIPYEERHQFYKDTHVAIVKYFNDKK